MMLSASDPPTRRATTAVGLPAPEASAVTAPRGPALWSDRKHMSCQNKKRLSGATNPTLRRGMPAGLWYTSDYPWGIRNP